MIGSDTMTFKEKHKDFFEGTIGYVFTTFQDSFDFLKEYNQCMNEGWSYEKLLRIAGNCFDICKSKDSIGYDKWGNYITVKNEGRKVVYQTNPYEINLT